MIPKSLILREYAFALANAHYRNLINQKIRIGTQDLKIAAIALSVDNIVVTRNLKDFGKVPNLRLQDWTIENI